MENKNSTLGYTAAICRDVHLHKGGRIIKLIMVKLPVTLMIRKAT